MSERSGSIAFDRAAEYYDRTRELSAPAMDAPMRMLRRELEGRGRVLEIGIGTGRIALPLAAAGVPLAGVDLSVPMVRRLVAKAGGRPPFPLAIADATALPFRAGVFGGAYVAHVLHLIQAWRDAVREMVRVVRAGGVVLADTGGEPGPQGKVHARFAREAGVMRRQIGLASSEVGRWDELMAGLGARRRLLPQVVDERQITLEEFVRSIERGEYSWTWPVPEESLRKAAAATREWATTQFGPLDRTSQSRGVLRWRAYDLPAG